MLCNSSLIRNSQFIPNKMKQTQLFHNFIHSNYIQTSNLFSKHYHKHIFQRNFSSINEIRLKADNGDPQAMFNYGSYLIDQNNQEIGLKYLKKSADLGNIHASAKYSTLLYEKVNNTNNIQAKIDLIPYLKTAASTNDLAFLRMHATICLQLPSFFRDGLSSLKKCVDNGDKESAEYFGTLKLLANNFQISSCFKYLQMSDSPRSKAIIEFFDKASEEAKQKLQQMADKNNDIISSVISIFAELLTTGETNRIENVYQRLMTNGPDSISEPWKTVLLNSVGTVCLGIGKLDEAYNFYQKAYENGSTEQLYFLSYLRFYKNKNDKIKRRETFNMIKKAYDMQIDTDEYDVTQKYAYMLLIGDGCEKNPTEAVKVIESKENRNMTDNLLFGVALMNSKRPVEGIEILHQSADDGDARCQKFYAFYLLNNEKDRKINEAKKYLKLASNGNDQEAQNILKKLEKGEYPDQSDVSLPDLASQPNRIDI